MGIAPLEHAPLVFHRAHAPAAVLTLGLVGFAPLLVLLGPLMWSSTPDGRVVAVAGTTLGVLGFTLGALRLVDLVVARPRTAGERGVWLADGRFVPVRVWRWFALRSATPSLSAVTVLLAVFAATEGSWTGRLTSLAVASPLVLLAAWAGLRGVRQLLLVGDLHFADPALALARAERSLAGRRVGPHLRPWVALGRLWVGDLAGAEALAEADGGEATAFVRAWAAAGRGEVDLDRALAEPEPTLPGDRWRAGIALALAALRAGRAAEVHARCPRWEELAAGLPERYGALWLRLSVGVRRACGEPAVDPPGVAWVARVWPFVP